MLVCVFIPDAHVCFQREARESMQLLKTLPMDVNLDLMQALLT